ncbi:hypothetical protein [Prosthecobacter sp.]|uniref:hypothetical protein n=1 Tax=Prosthecobacter sp. TaxID=1965333 RepID=UPI001D1D8453|nr:hypothetical protein [Prosthecobacter sp.]MCB1275352.1 hypothetical protein [Prosthecobacter sp.]
MNAKRHARKPRKKRQWQPEHWLMLWEIIWNRLPWTIWAFAVLLLAVACLIHALAVGNSPSSAMSEWFSITRWFLPR